MTAVVDIRQRRLDAIADVGSALAAMPTGISPPITHRFTAGLYSREMRLNAGDCIESMQHRTEHQFVVAYGECVVASDTESLHLSAGHIGITKPGTKRIILAVTDLCWVTFHPTTLTDPDEIWRALVVTDSELLEAPQ